jgi:hypothetical protein
VHSGVIRRSVAGRVLQPEGRAMLTRTATAGLGLRCPIQAATFGEPHQQVSREVSLR